MSQGMTIKGKTVQGQSVEVLVDDTGRVLLAPESVGGGSSESAGYRHDDEGAYSADGQPHPLLFNSIGRLKVSTMPGLYEPSSGVLTTTVAPATSVVDAVGGNGYIAVDVRRASNVMFSLQNVGSVSMAAGQFAIEASLDSTDGVNGTWIAIQAVRSNANTVVTNTGTLTATVGNGAGFGFEASVNANTWFRLRVTTNVTTNAAAKWTIVRGSYATEPIPAAQASSTQPVSGTVTITHPIPSVLNFSSAATTNTTVVKGSAGTLYAIKLRNKAATTLYLKLYNKATAPVLATDVPILTIPIAANSLLDLDFSVVGHRFTLGIGIATTVNEADTDTTAVALADLRGLITYI